MSKFEKNALHKINLTEGFLKLILRTMMAPKMKKLLRAMEKERDENLKSAGIDLKSAMKEFERSVSNFCDQYPNDPICKK